MYKASNSFAYLLPGNALEVRQRGNADGVGTTSHDTQGKVHGNKAEEDRSTVLEIS
ncbi:hypothetical protein EYZ11_008177 [Aspergillus tanneri]|uniref:Uncharacterized protein n=1 Tax=Aspergillus tanneri TaxID=1220188 RepID=A0A4S3JGN5_9EURO|nr:hypothetical protein EYZ11_008177 [Aspergillus tanneri]